jgi:hypothetical protein
MSTKIRTDGYVAEGQATLEYPVFNNKTVDNLMIYEDGSDSAHLNRGLILVMSLPLNDVLLPYIILAWMEDFLMDYVTLNDVLSEGENVRGFVQDNILPALEKQGIELPYPTSIVERVIKKSLLRLQKEYQNTEILELLDITEITPELLYRMYVISTTVLSYKSDGSPNKINSHCMFPEDYDKQLKQEMSDVRTNPSFHTFNEENDMRSVVKTRILLPQTSTRAALIRMCIKCSILQRINNSTMK